MKFIAPLLIALVGCTNLGGGSQAVGQGQEEPVCSDVCHQTNGQDGIAICHVPPGNPENPLSLCVGAPAVNPHMEQHEDDSCGVCPSYCGDGTCDEGEACGDCPADCGDCPEPTCEELGNCPEPTCEELGNCPEECEITCGSIDCPEGMFCNSTGCCETEVPLET